MTKLINVIEIGRYENTETEYEYDIKKGTDKESGVELIFYLYRGRRKFISDSDFNSNFRKVD